MEAYFWLPNSAFAAVEDDSVLWGSLYQLDQVPIVLLRGSAVDESVIMIGYDSG